MKEQVMQILAKVNKDILPYTGNNLVADGIIDSFELTDVISRLEDTFDIEIDAEWVTEENFGNAQRIVAMIEELVKG